MRTKDKILQESFIRVLGGDKPRARFFDFNKDKIKEIGTNGYTIFPFLKNSLPITVYASDNELHFVVDFKFEVELLDDEKEWFTHNNIFQKLREQNKKYYLIGVFNNKEFIIYAIYDTTKSVYHDISYIDVILNEMNINNNYFLLRNVDFNILFDENIETKEDTNSFFNEYVQQQFTYTYDNFVAIKPIGKECPLFFI